MSRTLIAGIETGGTKILARICDFDSGATIAERRWPTTTPEQAADDLGAFLSDLPGDARLAAIGMAAFGPLIVDPASPDYGRMLATTKPGWTGTNLRADLEARLRVPIALETDVSAAAIAEQAFGAGKHLSSVAYVTVGTGIGAGLAINGQSLKGAVHPEAGHLRLARLAGDEMPSVCRFHPDCAEGLASGPAVQRRLSEDKELADDPATIDLVAAYLGQLAAALVLAWSPQRIIWGGGVIEAAPLTRLIGPKLRDTLAGYGVGQAVEEPDFCVQALLENSGLHGALFKARQLAAFDLQPS